MKNSIGILIAVTLLATGIGTCAADELVFYAFPSPMGINWRSPSSLAWSSLFNQVIEDANYTKQHPIGHVDVEVKCDATADAPAAYALTGMTNSDDSEMNDALLKSKHGLGILFDDFKGRLETAEEVEKDFPARYSSGRVSYLRFLINSGTCRRVMKYLREYEAAGYQNHYGLPNRPRYGEGSGCTAFGVSVLEVAGLMQTDFASAWAKSIRVPKALVGGPLTGDTISVFHLLFGSHSGEWAREDEPHFRLSFYDPDAMYRSIRHAWKQNEKTPSGDFTNETREQAKGLLFDRRGAAIPTGPIWLRD